MTNKVPAPPEFRDAVQIPDLATDEPHRWEIEPHYLTDFDVLVTNNDDEAREAILEIAEQHLWDGNEQGQERVMKVRMNDVPQDPRTIRVRSVSPDTAEVAEIDSKLIGRFINAAWLSVEVTEEGDAWLDRVKAEKRVRDILSELASVGTQQADADQSHPTHGVCANCRHDISLESDGTWVHNGTRISMCSSLRPETTWAVPAVEGHAPPPVDADDEEK